MLKRLFDICLSSISLLLLFPYFLMIALGIKFTMPGPVFFRQTRIGYRCTPFSIFKFRSMVVNNSELSVTLKSDERITSFGRFLRKSKSDELPQLLNILKGEMSFVGPRPDVPGYSDKLQGEDQLLWTVKPGLTGLDSISYPNEEELLDRQPDPQRYYDEVLWPEKVRINVLYIKNQSFWLDIEILIRTLFGRWKKANPGEMTT